METERGDVRGGTLYLVATPLGNPRDMSPRAQAVLDGVDYIAAEDTRRAALLMSTLGIGNAIISYYEQNKNTRHDRILRDLEEGRSVAVISDAGMPCVSDPGEAIVRLAIEKRIPVSVIPGPSAFVSAISASGFDTTRFVFEGFIPAKGKARNERLSDMAAERRTIVFYEAPHRLRKTLTDLTESGLGGRRMAIARELTKTYEEFLYFQLDEACTYYETMNPRGEFTLVLEGKAEFEKRTGAADASQPDEDALIRLLKMRLDSGASVRDAADEVRALTGVPRKRLYTLALDLERRR